MKENKYNNSHFFSQYSQMSRSVEGLKGAGEWHVLQKMLPDFAGKRVLDLGCGFGWHCAYAIEHGATRVTGIDIPKRCSKKPRKETLLHSLNINVWLSRTLIFSRILMIWLSAH